MKTFADQDVALVETAREIRDLCADGAFPEHLRQRLFRIADNVGASAAVVADAVQHWTEERAAPRAGLPPAG